MSANNFLPHDEPSAEELAAHLINIVPPIMHAVSIEMRREATVGFQMAHYRLLRLIAQAPRTVSELAASQSVSVPTMSRSVSVLVERGLVRRVEDPHDRRRTLLEITDEGEALFERLRRQLQQRLAEQLETLTPQERRLALAGLEVLEKALLLSTENKSPTTATKEA
ncbi:hypothetical protein ARMA_1437 [Ardenticatena maritima]|uniref:HTH marR-type domain-containing protein n=1 Tax=Ardenticatena maritima TaxID=872965 RepID=A0A0M9UCJ1_9CHLR|nr:MarR family transcriptional regulator [Ardenticatena maritima]GAP63014.1 hypothetical protein ARMA_1437 [Ardenticatena maritima]